MPKLTEDMVTVDDDMKTAIFSESYLNDVIKSIADFFAADNEAAGKEFLASAEITGKYNVEEKRAELVLKYKTEATGDVIMTIGQKNDAEKGPVGLLKTEWTVVMNGISMPTVSELTVYGVEYDGKKPVCGTFEIATTTGASFDYQEAVRIIQARHTRKRKAELRCRERGRKRDRYRREHRARECQKHSCDRGRQHCIFDDEQRLYLCGQRQDQARYLG